MTAIQELIEIFHTYYEYDAMEAIENEFTEEMAAECLKAGNDETIMEAADKMLSGEDSKKEKLETLQSTLPKIGFDLEFNKNNEIKWIENLPVGSFIREGKLFVSAENGDGCVDYYGEFQDGYPYIHSKLEEWAEKNKGFWEWESPACIYFCLN